MTSVGTENPAGLTSTTNHLATCKLDRMLTDPETPFLSIQSIFVTSAAKRRPRFFARGSAGNRFVSAAVVLLLTISAQAKTGHPPAPAEEWVVVVPVANMYSSATESADVVSQAILGSRVAVLRVQGQWVKVRTSDRYSGWMPATKLRKVLQEKDSAQKRFVQVDSLFANLYRETDVTKHRPVITIPFESRLEVVAEGTGDDTGWLRVKLPDQKIAWIQSSDINLDPQPLTIDESIALAKRFLGLPYLWGGRSSYGYDCSGFTQMLVRSRGINMPRDADRQAAWDGGEAVERKDLQAGDLLFFGEGPDKITHTAMYIGDGQIIHATTHGRPVIQISQLDDEPWTKLLVACRRVK